jgi:hypothetical protein
MLEYTVAVFLHLRSPLTLKISFKAKSQNAFKMTDKYSKKTNNAQLIYIEFNVLHMTVIELQKLNGLREGSRIVFSGTQLPLKPMMFRWNNPPPSTRSRNKRSQKPA